MSAEIQLQVFEIIVIIAGAFAVWMNTRNRRMDASTAVIAADAKQADAVTALALGNNQERQYLQEQLSKLRENFSHEQGTHAAEMTALQGRLDRLQVKADASEAQVHLLEGKMSDLTQARTADQATIAELKTEIISLKTEIISLNKTIVTLTDENNGLKKRLNELYERVIGKQESVVGIPGAAIPIALTASGTITPAPTEVNNAAPSAESKST